MKHYLHGRIQIPEGPLNAPTRAADGLRIAPFENSAAGPAIELVKQGDKVTRLIVTCTCGEKIEIECVYPAAG